MTRAVGGLSVRTRQTSQWIFNQKMGLIENLIREHDYQNGNRATAKGTQLRILGE